MGRGWRGPQGQVVGPRVDGLDDPLPRHLQLWQEHPLKALVHTWLWTSQFFVRTLFGHLLHPTDDQRQEKGMMMIKKTIHIKRNRSRAPKIRPSVQPDWYKRFRQLASLADKSFKVKL